MSCPMPSGNTSLERLQVLLEAKNHWFKIVSHARNDLDSIYEQDPHRVRGFSALDALKKVEVDDYPGDSFWETVDWAQLETDLIEMINSQLGPDKNYQHEMLVRNRKTVEPK
jgi:hypothetical protein